MPSFDATAVARLRAAGAIVIGKTNMDSFGMGSSTEQSDFHVSLRSVQFSFVTTTTRVDAHSVAVTKQTTQSLSSSLLRPAHPESMGHGAGARRIVRRLCVCGGGRAVCGGPGVRHRYFLLVLHVGGHLSISLDVIKVSQSINYDIVLVHNRHALCMAGGSIRQPAHFCGVVGVKPTYGRVSRYGLIAYASSLDVVGPVAGSVRDAAVLLSVIAGERNLFNSAQVKNAIMLWCGQRSIASLCLCQDCQFAAFAPVAASPSLVSHQLPPAWA